MDQDQTSLIVEAPPAILDAPRTILADHFSCWLASEGVIDGLPKTEIIISITTGRLLSPDLVGVGEAIGCHVVSRGGALWPRWEVALAYGEESQDHHDVASWLSTIPHELLHLAEFARSFGGRLPHEIGRTALIEVGVGERDEAEEERFDAVSADIVDSYITLHGERVYDPALLPGWRHAAREVRRQKARSR